MVLNLYNRNDVSFTVCDGKDPSGFRGLSINGDSGGCLFFGHKSDVDDFIKRVKFHRDDAFGSQERSGKK